MEVSDTPSALEPVRPRSHDADTVRNDKHTTMSAAQQTNDCMLHDATQKSAATTDPTFMQIMLSCHNMLTTHNATMLDHAISHALTSVGQSRRRTCDMAVTRGPSTPGASGEGQIPVEPSCRTIDELQEGKTSSRIRDACTTNVTFEYLSVLTTTPSH